MRRDDQGAPVVTRRMVILDGSAADEIRLLPAEIVIRLVCFLGGALDVILLHRPATSPHRCRPHRDRASWNAPDPLHIVESRVDRIGEGYDVAASRGMNGGKV